MFSFRSGNLPFGVMLATAFSCSMLPTAGRAYTPEEQQACSDDAFRLCGPEIPDVDRITACMVRNKSQLSARCRVFFRREPETQARKPVSAKPRKPGKSVKPGVRAAPE